jgi:uncharacterized paraquat-inducible protein A
MRRSLQQLYDLLAAVLPFIFLMMGGLGAIYAISSKQKGSFFMAFSLLILLVGITIFTYQKFAQSKLFLQRFGQKEKKKKHKSRRMGKRCPQCNQLIYHRRTTCQHCSYVFPSHKPDSNDPEQPDEEKET